MSLRRLTSLLVINSRNFFCFMGHLDGVGMGGRPPTVLPVVYLNPIAPAQMMQPPAAPTGPPDLITACHCWNKRHTLADQGSVGLRLDITFRNQSPFIAKSDLSTTVYVIVLYVTGDYPMASRPLSHMVR